MPRFQHKSSMLTEILPPEERAIESIVSRYTRVSGAVTRFARSLSGNDKLSVRVGSEASASGDEIILDPGVFQAAYTRRAPVTPAEVALASALHECVHLVSSDFEEARELEPSWFSNENEVVPGTFTLLDALYRAEGPPGTAMFLAVEDARQELQGLSAYPGARSVLDDMYRAATPAAFDASGLLSQFALACFLMVGDYNTKEQLERRTHGQVAAALADATPHVKAIRKVKSPWDVAREAVDLLRVARVHGLIATDGSTETRRDKKQRQEDEAQSMTETLDRLRLHTKVLSSQESYEEVRNANQARSADSKTQGQSQVASHEGADQILRVSQAPTVYLPSGQGGKLLVAPFPQSFRQFAPAGHESIARAAKQWNASQRTVSGELYPLFAANQRRGLQTGFDSGDLSPHAPLLVAAGLYDRMYERRAQRSRRSYAVSLLIDGSASMLQTQTAQPTNRTRWGMAAASLGAWMLADLCNELQIDFEVAMFNRSFGALATDSEKSYTHRLSQAKMELQSTQGSSAPRLIRTVNHYMIKPFDRRWRSQSDLLAGFFHTIADPQAANDYIRKNRATAPPVSMFTRAANVDELNVTHAADRLNGLGANVRVLVVLADGMTRGSVDDLKATVEAAEKTGVTVLGIGIGDDTVSRVYRRSKVVESPQDLADAMIGGVRGALRKSLRMTGLEMGQRRDEFSIGRSA